MHSTHDFLIGGFNFIAQLSQFKSTFYDAYYSLIPTLNAILLKCIYRFLDLIFFSLKTSLRFEQRTLNDDLAEFHRIYIRNSCNGSFFFRSAQK